MKSKITILSTFFILILLFICSKAHVSHPTKSLESSTSSGFSLDLIHREFSPSSPFYNPLATHSDRLKNVIRRSISRHNNFRPKCRSPSESKCSIESDIRGIDGEYLMKLLIGTPPVETLATADTGSDLTWIQCKPCKKCFEHVNPLFNLRASSSYKTLKCTSKQCKSLLRFSGNCTRKHNKCQYIATYADGSFSHGHLATETLTFGTSSIEKFTFGCGHNNRGIFSNNTSGIIGLGGGPLSIISQLEETIQRKFSYCLAPFFQNETSRIYFGEQEQVSSSKVVSTPLFQTPDKTYYYLHLEKIIIGNVSFVVPRSETKQHVQSGNIVIDSGTALTYLPNGEFYDGIVSTLKEAMGIVETIDDPDKVLHLCYETNSNIKPPVITFQFKDATIEIPESSAFVELGEGITCFTMAPVHSPFPAPIFGSISQWNFLVSYDLHNKMVSFQAADCNKKF